LGVLRRERLCLSYSMLLYSGRYEWLTWIYTLKNSPINPEGPSASSLGPTMPPSGAAAGRTSRRRAPDGRREPHPDPLHSRRLGPDPRDDMARNPLVSIALAKSLGLRFQQPIERLLHRLAHPLAQRALDLLRGDLDCVLALHRPLDTFWLMVALFPVAGCFSEPHHSGSESGRSSICEKHRLSHSALDK
jgi:hypothetical protein